MIILTAMKIVKINNKGTFYALLFGFQLIINRLFGFVVTEQHSSSLGGNNGH